MKTIQRIFFLIIIALCITQPLSAKERRFLIWFPGGSGSTEEAQPLMDLLATYLSSHSSSKWIATYISTEPEGLAFISKHKPEIGIVSRLMALQHPTLIQQRLTTIPKSTGKPLDDYMIISGPVKESIDNPTLLTAEPFNRASFDAFFASTPLLAAAKRWPIAPTATLLSSIRQSGEGSGHMILITANEWQTLQTLAAPWAKGLTIIAKTTVPASPLVEFGSVTDWDNLEPIFLNMKQDSEGQSLLTELRLSGFARP